MDSTGARSKRDSTGAIYLQHGRYTTCDDPHPDFYISLSRAKVRPGKDVVFGPTLSRGVRCADAFGNPLRILPIYQELQ